MLKKNLKILKKFLKNLEKIFKTSKSGIDFKKLKKFVKRLRKEKNFSNCIKNLSKVLSHI